MGICCYLRLNGGGHCAAGAACVQYNGTPVGIAEACNSLKPIAEWEPNNAVWGQNYPLEYEAYKKTAVSDTKTKYGGAFPRDYLEEDPRLVILFAGNVFSKDYLQARGHYYSLTDATKTGRQKYPVNAGSCMTCKSTDVPRLMNEMGAEQFYAANFHDLRKQVSNPIGCQDCHDPKTMNLRITRPALKEGLKAAGRDVNEMPYQQMRSLVCAQCHVEYYFKTQPLNYLTFPWHNGLSVENMIAYYDKIEFSDYTHAISKTPIIKAQHPDYELYSTGIHRDSRISGCFLCRLPHAVSKRGRHEIHRPSCSKPAAEH